MRQVDGFWFPATDRHGAEAALREVADTIAAIRHVRSFNVCVQAGGNCGVFPAFLATKFEQVWTFEPDLENYHCLIKNVPHNVIHFMAGLGNKCSQMSLDRVPGNCGAHQTVMIVDGRIPMMTIDELQLDHCDMIQLDIEGFEPLAIDGAKETIAEFRPVLMLEDKDMSRRYGYKHGWPELEIPGYKVAGRVHNDVILVPE